VESLANTVHERGVDVLLPVAEIATVLVTENMGTLRASLPRAVRERAAIAWAADKAEVTRTAMQLGLPVPRTVFLERPECLSGMLEACTFPVVVKPRGSRLRGPECWLNSGVRYAADAAELAARGGRQAPAGVSAAAPGADCRARDGRVRLLRPRRARCDLQPQAPTREATDWRGERAVGKHRGLSDRPPLHGAAPRRSGWHGVAMVEFKIDRRDQLPKLMEINGRFWGSLQLAIDAGVDFPAILLQTLEAVEAPASAAGVPRGSPQPLVLGRR
jgi:hypothetical protein